MWTTNCWNAESRRTIVFTRGWWFCHIALKPVWSYLNFSWHPWISFSLFFENHELCWESYFLSFTSISAFNRNKVSITNSHKRSLQKYQLEITMQLNLLHHFAGKSKIAHLFINTKLVLLLQTVFTIQMEERVGGTETRVVLIFRLPIIEIVIELQFSRTMF